MLSHIYMMAYGMVAKVLIRHLTCMHASSRKEFVVFHLISPTLVTVVYFILFFSYVLQIDTYFHSP